MIHKTVIPNSAWIDGQWFTYKDLERGRPRWWWWPRRREAWRKFRQRLITISHQINEGYINHYYCWAEVHVYLVHGHQGALSAAEEITRVMVRAQMLDAAVNVRLPREVLPRLAQAAQLELT